MLKNFLTSKQIHLQRKQPRFVQRWIETGDERCPLAGMWTVLAESQAETTGEADLCGRILSWAFRGCACPLPTLAA